MAHILNDQAVGQRVEMGLDQSSPKEAYLLSLQHIIIIIVMYLCLVNCIMHVLTKWGLMWFMHLGPHNLVTINPRNDGIDMSQ